MEYTKALDLFGKYYIDRYSVEFPTIFSLCDFKGKSVLELGAGQWGYFAKEAIKVACNYVATDISVSILRKLKQNVKVKTTVCRAESLPFPDNSFDIVFSRWVAQDVKDLEKAVKEMCRVAKSCVVLVLPSEEGDETKMLQIKFPDKYNYRKTRIKNMRRWLSECDLIVGEVRKKLNFIFPNIKFAIEILSALGFKNKLNKNEKHKLEEFFLKRKTSKGIIFSQGAAFICGIK